MRRLVDIAAVAIGAACHAATQESQRDWGPIEPAHGHGKCVFFAATNVHIWVCITFVAFQLLPAFLMKLLLLLLCLLLLVAAAMVHFKTIGLNETNRIQKVNEIHMHVYACMYVWMCMCACRLLLADSQ